MHFDRQRKWVSPKVLSDNSKFEDQRFFQTVFISMQDLFDLALYQRKLKDSRHQIRSMESQICLYVLIGETESEEIPFILSKIEILQKEYGDFARLIEFKLLHHRFIYDE
jgi:hypothetical protein